MTRSLLAVLLSLFAGLAQAAVIFTANLTNGQENPPTVPTIDGSSTLRPASFGTATFFLNDAMTQLTVSVSVSNLDFGRVPSQGTPVVNPPVANPNPQTPILNDDLLVAHIHRAPVGVNGPVIWGFIGTPFNDNNPNNVVVTPFASPGVGGTVTARWDAGEGNNTTLTAELPNLLAGNTYINFHTIQFGGGEIRGQILVPEPGTLALLGLALGALALRRRAAR